MIVTNTITFPEAVEIIRKMLPPQMQDDAFAQSATYRALSLQWTVIDFYKWLDIVIDADERKTQAEASARVVEANARVAEANARVAEANARISEARATQNAQEIIEPEVCMLVEDTFRTSFSITCMYDMCKNIITLAEFYVIRDKNVFYACCDICYTIESENGKPGKPVIAAEHRRLTWEHHVGNNAFGSCYHCNDRTRESNPLLSRVPS